MAPHERLPELPIISREKPHTGATAREKPMRRSRHHERRAIFNCMVCRSSVNLLSKLHRTLDSL